MNKRKIAVAVLGLSALATLSLNAGPSVSVQVGVPAPPPVVVVAPAPVVVAPAPAPVVVVQSVPDTYVYDGVEYVGVVGSSYFYLGPNHVWIAFDSERETRFHAWEHDHHDWREHTVHNDNFRGHDDHHDDHHDAHDKDHDHH